MIDRREFLKTTAASGALLPSATPVVAGQKPGFSEKAGLLFQMNYAPHFGMFQHTAGENFTDQLAFIAENGFKILEDPGLKQRSLENQQEIREGLLRYNLALGLFTGYAEFERPAFASGRSDHGVQVLREIHRSVELARSMNARWFSVVPGRAESRLPRTAQFANALELLKRCAEICERSGVVMLLEPLLPSENTRELLLQSLPQAAQLCRRVNSPSCRVLFDVYEQSERFSSPAAPRCRNLTEAFDRYRDTIGYIQVGDNPGRKEPGTGTIDFQKLFRHLRMRGYSGAIGMDHGNSQPGVRGERTVLDAYRTYDPS